MSRARRVLPRLGAAVAVLGLAAATVAAPTTAGAAPADGHAIDRDYATWDDADIAYTHVAPLNVAEQRLVQTFVPTVSGPLRSFTFVGKLLNRSVHVVLSDASGFVEPSGSTPPTYSSALATAVVDPDDVGEHTGNLDQRGTVPFDASPRLEAGHEYVLAMRSEAVDPGGYSEAWFRTAFGDPVGSTPGTVRQFSNYESNTTVTDWTSYYRWRNSFSVSIAPPVSAVVTPSEPSGEHGWYDTTPSIDYVCDVSVLSGCPTDHADVSDGDSTFSGTLELDGDTEFPWYFTLKVDTVAPTLTGTVVTPVRPDGRYDSDIRVAWTCDDETSGVDECPADTVVTGKGADTVATATVRDKAGNETTTSVTGLRRDAGAPIISISGVQDGRRYAPQTELTPTCSARSRNGGTLQCSGATDVTRAKNGDRRFVYTAKATDPAGASATSTASWTVTAAHKVTVKGLPKKKKGRPSLKAGKRYVLTVKVRTFTGKVVRAKPSLRHEKHAAPKVRKAGKKKNGTWKVTLRLPKADRKTFQTIAVVTSNGTVHDVEVHVR